jgi:hypothetical protein
VSQSANPHTISSLGQLLALYNSPIAEASIKKEVPHITPHYRALIEASPFALLATAGPGGLDLSPRGDPPGFVKVQDPTTLLLPERRGNNRIDSLRNLLHDPRMALLFLIPNLGETLRVNGQASISVDPELLGRFPMEDKLPKCVLVIEVETVFFQCARALHRSRLWERAREGTAPDLPSTGTILAALSTIDAEQYDRELPNRQRSTLY